MDLHLFIWTLLLVLGVDGGATERCPASRGTKFNLSFASRRNLTGHWIVTVDSMREDPRHPSSPNSPVEMTVDIVQHMACCEDTETVQLAATAVMNAVPTVQGVTGTPTVATSEPHVTTASSDTTPIVTETTSRAPPAGYEVVNDLGYYKMHTNAVIWEQARDKCVLEGAHLIIVNSNQEAEIVKTLFKRHQSEIQGGETCCSHAGFDDRVTEGNYITVLGEPLSSSGYMVWQGGAWHDREHDCGYIVGSTAMMDIHVCSKKFAFICEFSAQ